MWTDFYAIAKGIPWSIGLTLLAFLMGAALGFPLCALRLAPWRPLRGAAIGIILTLRSIPPIVWLFFIFFGIGSGLLSVSPFVAAVVGLGLITAANMAEIYRGALTAIHAGQWEAAKMLNLSRPQQFLDIIMPQMLRIALPSAATYAIGLLKDSAVASAIGVPDIALMSYQVSQQTFRGLSVYGSAAFIYIALSLPMAWFARWADIQLRAKVSH